MITAIHKSMAAKRDAIKNNDKGFTLIELLVVVLIIGILAAIAIPVFLGQQDQAKNAAIQSDLGNAKIAMISYATANSGTYLGVSNQAATQTALSTYGYTGTSVAVVTGGSTFCLQGNSAATGSPAYKITSSSGAVPGTC